MQSYTNQGIPDTKRSSPTFQDMPTTLTMATIQSRKDMYIYKAKSVKKP
jgi:hypothetical protein